MEESILVGHLRAAPDTPTPSSHICAQSQRLRCHRTVGVQSSLHALSDQHHISLHLGSSVVSAEHHVVCFIHTIWDAIGFIYVL